MNDKSQIDCHKEKVILLDCPINQTEEGYQASFPRCHWTSGVRETKEQTMRAYYRHLAYIMTRLGD